MNVLILRKTLSVPAEPPLSETVRVSLLRDEQDIDRWLALRERAFADESPPVRPWTRSDFLREFRETARGPRRVTWLAECTWDSNRLSGAVSLSLPKSSIQPASLHWLMVDPLFRRQGIGACLVQTAERSCWNLGFRELRLETHRGWKAAVQFYKRLGFYGGPL